LQKRRFRPQGDGFPGKATCSPGPRSICSIFLGGGARMTDRVYVQPLTFAPSPQAFSGDCVRLAGGMTYAREFAVTVTEDGAVARRVLATAETIDDVLGSLPDELGAEAEAQWANLRTAHSPLQLGERTIRLDGPQ